MHLAAAQLNFTVGDTSGNLSLMLKAIQEAKAQGMDMIVFPELALSGYPPEDLLYRQAYIAQINDALDTLMVASKSIVIVVGHPLQLPQGQYNALSVFHEGECISSYSKQFLPNQQVFDERRYFEQGRGVELVNFFGIDFAFVICEDIWHEKPVAQAKALGAELVVVINASPFTVEKMSVRYDLLKEHALSTGLPIIYINMVGGQDELVFDGGSFAVNAKGLVVSQAPVFQDLLWPIEIIHAEHVDILEQRCEVIPSTDACIYQALVLGVRDYYHKNHFKGILLGLSGGIDSALTLAIAADAVGVDSITAVLLPSRYTSELSYQGALSQCESMGVKHVLLSIEPAVEACHGILPKSLTAITEQNIQSRMRGVLLMALSNESGHLVLTTGNKSEYATGYTTLYGDMCGGYAPLKDVYKTQVYRLVEYRNGIEPVIPKMVIDRPPTAELAPNQQDSDALPPYDVLDSILRAYIDQGQDADEIVEQGVSAEEVSRVIRLLYQSEYKRRQSPPGPKVTHCAFGRDRRYPMTSGYKESLD